MFGISGEAAAEEIERDHAVSAREQREEPAVLVRGSARRDAVDEQHGRAVAGLGGEDLEAAPAPGPARSAEMVVRQGAGARGCFD